MERTIIDSLYSDFSSLLTFLGEKGEPSFQSFVDSTFKKTLVVFIGSLFEDKIREILLNMVDDRSANDDLVRNFLRNKAIERQYHSYFNWKDGNAKQFFGLFGEKFKDSAVQDVKNNQKLDEAIRVFLELGNKRNELSHINPENFVTDLTTEEIYQKYKIACNFIGYLELKLHNFGKQNQS
jgi:hypothetical protein